MQFKQAFISIPLLCVLCVSFSAYGADMNKTLRYALPVAETSFDPIVVSDHYSNIVIEAGFCNRQRITQGFIHVGTIR